MPAEVTLYPPNTEAVQVQLTIPPASPAVLMLSAAAGEAKHIIFNVAKFDPTKHPHGYKGLFIDTPDQDKKPVKDAIAGDTVTTKSGKFFHIEKKTEKGVKVKPVDPDSGEVKSGYTVLGHDTQIALVEQGKAPGSSWAVGELPPGTYIQHPKSGKKFKVTKHGNWTTVYPVDDQGNVKGKHTVLPKESMVNIVAASETDNPSKALTDQVKELAAQIKTVKYLPEPDQVLQDKDASKALEDNLLAVAFPQAKPGGQAHAFVDKVLANLHEEFGHNNENFKLGWVTAQAVDYEQEWGDYPSGEYLLKWEKEWDDAMAQTQSQFPQLSQAGKKLVPEYKAVEQAVLDNAVESVAKVVDSYHMTDGTKADLPKALEERLKAGGEPWGEGLSGQDVAYEVAYYFESQTGHNFGYVLQDKYGVLDATDATGQAIKDLADAFDHVIAKAKFEHAIEDMPSAPKPPTHHDVLDDPAWRQEFVGILADKEPAAGVMTFDTIDLIAKLDKQDSLSLDAAAEQWAKIRAEGWKNIWGVSPNEAGTNDWKSHFKEAMQEVIDKHTPVVAGIDTPEPTEKDVLADSTVSEDFYSKLANDLADGEPDLAADILNGVLGLDQPAWNDMVDQTLGTAEDGFSSWSADEVAKKKDAWNVYMVQAKQALSTKWAQESAKAQQSQPEQLAEVMPTKLPKVPKQYPPGAGKDTKIVIEAQPYAIQEAQGNAFSIYRETPDGSRKLLGTADSATSALRIARDSSAMHEPIITQSAKVQPPPTIEEFAAFYHEGQLVIDQYGGVRRVAKVEITTKNNWKGESEPVVRLEVESKASSTVKTTEQYYFAGTTPTWMPIPEIHAEAASVVWNTEGNNYPTIPSTAFRRAAMDHGMITAFDPVTKRQAHPEKYVPELQAEWSLDSLSGQPWADAHKSLTALGWREIKPRQKGFVRYINKGGKRLVLHRDSGGGVVTQIDEQGFGGIQLSGLSTGSELHSALQEALATGADLSDLDPRNAKAKEARYSHVQGMLYDLAVGKQNNIGAKVGSGAKVKSDEEYLTELEQEHEVPPIDDFLKLAEKPVHKVKARGSVIDSWGLAADPAWDFESRQFDVPTDFTVDQAAALQAILNHQGVTAIVLGDADKEPAIAEFAKIKHDPANPVPAWRLEEAAKLLAAEWQKAQKNDASVFDQLDDESVKYLYGAMEHNHSAMLIAIEGSETKWRETADNLRKQYAQDLIDERRKAEGTVKEATTEFELPLWEHVSMEPQTIEDIAGRVDQVPVHELDLPNGAVKVRPDVPAFYNGGIVKDGLVYYKSDQVDTKVELDHDEDMVARLSQLGATLGPNQHPIEPGYHGSSQLYNGQSMVYRENPIDAPLTFDKAGGLDTESAARVERALKQNGINPHSWMIAINAVASNAQSNGDDPVQALKDYAEGSFGLKYQSIWDGATTRPGKMVEYVPHGQASGSSGGAPTSQRGRLSLYGYTPTEAHDLLKNLGVVGDLEPEVPYDIIMRGPRRTGLVAPIHPAYIRGEADLPSTPARITHGITGGAALEAILQTGGLLSIEQRYRAGFLANLPTTSVSGDIRSGIDHAVFCTLGLGGACGGGSSIKIVMKPNAFLRRDIVLAPSDFGAAPTRYQSYKNYLNGLQTAVGESKTNIYTPVSPAARQHHLNDVSVSGSNEFNLGPNVPIEDIEAIGVPADQVQHFSQLLDDMMAKGEIASRPKVVNNTANGPDGIVSYANSKTTKVAL